MNLSLTFEIIQTYSKKKEKKNRHFTIHGVKEKSLHSDIDRSKHNPNLNTCSNYEIIQLHSVTRCEKCPWRDQLIFKRHIRIYRM